MDMLWSQDAQSIGLSNHKLKSALNCTVFPFEFVKVIYKLDSMRLFSQRRSPTPHLGVPAEGGYDPKFELGWDFCIMHLPPPQVPSSYVYSFGSYRVDKQTDAAENIQRYSLHYDVG